MCTKYIHSLCCASWNLPRLSCDFKCKLNTLCICLVNKWSSNNQLIIWYFGSISALGLILYKAYNYLVKIAFFHFRWPLVAAILLVCNVHCLNGLETTRHLLILFGSSYMRHKTISSSFEVLCLDLHIA